MTAGCASRHTPGVSGTAHQGNGLRGHEIPELAHGGTTINVVGGLVTSVTLDEANQRAITNGGA